MELIISFPILFGKLFYVIVKLYYRVGDYVKKVLSILILLVLFVPNFVLADENIEIKTLDFIEKSEDVVENSSAKVENGVLKFDLKFINVGDYAKYKVLVKNNTDLDLIFDESNLMLDDKSVGYEIEYQKGNNIKAKSESYVYLKVIYAHKADSTLFRNSIYDASEEAKLNLTDNFISIPNTLRNIGIIPLAIMLLTIGAIIYGLKIGYTNKKVTSLQLLIIAFIIIFLPKYADALNVYEIPVHSRIIIVKVKPKPCTFEGNLTQGAQFVEGQYTYRYMQEFNGSGWDNISNDGWGVVLTDRESTDPATSDICSSINDKPIVSMRNTYLDAQASSIVLESVDTSHVVNMSGMFFGASNITELDLSSFNTSNVTNMDEMFGLIGDIKKLYLRHFDISNVTSFNNMFYGLSSLEELNLDEWNFNKTYVKSLMLNIPSLKKLSVRYWTGLKNPYYWANNVKLSSTDLETIDVTGWDLSDSYDIGGVFYQLVRLKTIIGLDTWDTSSITTLSSLFQNCQNLEEVDLSTWDTSNVTYMGYMFYQNYALKSVNLSNFNTSKVTSFSYMFYYDYLLTEIDLSSFDFSSALSLEYMFCYDVNLRNIIMPTSTIARNVTNTRSMYSGNYMLDSIDLSHFDFSNLTSNNSSYMFYTLYGLTEVKAPMNLNVTIDIGKTLYDGDTGYSTIPVNNSESITIKSKREAVFEQGTSFSSNMRALVGNSEDIKHFKRSDTLPDKIYNNSFTYAKGSANDSPYPIYLYYVPEDDHTVYYYCEIEKVYLNPDPYSMFASFVSLETIETKDMDSSRATTLSYFVKSDYSLKSLDISHFDTSKVTSFYGAFKFLYSLREFDVSNFDISNVSSIGEIFTYSGMEELDLSSWDLSNVGYKDFMITDMPNLKRIKTPKNVGSKSFELPTTYVDEDGNQYDYIDSNTPTKTWLRAIQKVYFRAYSPATVSPKMLTFDPTKTDVYSGLPIPTSEGYTFKKWVADGLTITNGSKLINKYKLELYPIWEENEVEFELIYNSGIKGKFKKLASGSSATYSSDKDEKIKHIVHVTDASKVPSNLTGDNVLTENNSIKKAYAWFEEDTIYYYSEIGTLPLNDGYNLFSNFAALEDIDLSGFDFSNVEDFNRMFENCFSLKTIDFSNVSFDNAVDFSYMFENCKSLVTVKFGVHNSLKLNKISSMFKNCESLKSVDLNNLNTSNVTGMYNVFAGCKSLETFKMAGIEVNNSTSLTYFFSGCTSLKSVDFRGFGGSNVTDITSMFSDCTSLKSIDFTGFDTSHITKLNNVFQNCTSLETLDFSKYNFNSVTSIYYMCYGCTNLRSVNFNGINSTLTSVAFAFTGCRKLSKIDFGTVSINDTSAKYIGSDANFIAEIKTPMQMIGTGYIPLPNNMYYQNNNTSISQINSNTTPNVTIKSRKWS